MKLLVIIGSVIILVGIVVVFFVRQNREMSRFQEYWNNKAKAMPCPKCGVNYSGWSDSAIWGDETDPTAHGMVFKCEGCRAAAMVRESGDKLEVVNLIEDYD